MSTYTKGEWRIGSQMTTPLLTLIVSENGRVIATTGGYTDSTRPDQGTGENIDNAARILSLHNAHEPNGAVTRLLEAARAALRYDAAIQRHAEQIAQTAPDETRKALGDDATVVFVESDNLDPLYEEWVVKTRNAIVAVEAMEADHD